MKKTLFCMMAVMAIVAGAWCPAVWAEEKVMGKESPENPEPVPTAISLNKFRVNATYGVSYLYREPPICEFEELCVKIVGNQTETKETRISVTVSTSIPVEGLPQTGFAKIGMLFIAESDMEEIPDCVLKRIALEAHELGSGVAYIVNIGVSGKRGFGVGISFGFWDWGYCKEKSIYFLQAVVPFGNKDSASESPSKNVYNNTYTYDTIDLMAEGKEPVIASGVTEVLEGLTKDREAVIRTDMETLERLKEHSNETQENIGSIMEDRSELSSSSYIVASVGEKASEDRYGGPSREIKIYINREAPNGEAIVYISGPRALITQALAVAAQEAMGKRDDSLTIRESGSLLLRYGEE